MGTSNNAIRRLAAVGLLAIVAAMGAARADAVPAPKIVEASGLHGWSNSLTAFAARYDRELADSTTVTMSYTDATGAHDVPGAISTQQCTGGANSVCAQSAVVTFTPAAPFDPAKAPYTAVIAARSTSQGPTDTPSSDTFSFKLDTTEPETPVIQSPKPATDDVTHFETGAVAITGTANDRSADRAGKPVAASGISKIELRFYNVAESFSVKPGDTAPCVPSGTDTPATIQSKLAGCQAVHGGSTEVTKYHTEIVVCPTHVCSGSTQWSATPATPLDPGYWTVQAFAWDEAGMRSADSQTVSFIVAPGAPGQ